MAKLLTGTRIYGTGTVDTQLFVSGTNSATSTTTGALQVVGGVGVGGNLHVGGIIYGAILGTATTATNADNVKTVLQVSSATYYPTFVDANNSTAAYEAVYTTSSFVINPSTGFTAIGTSAAFPPDAPLTIAPMGYINTTTVTDTFIHLAGDTTKRRLLIDSTSPSGPVILGRQANGTQLLPTATSASNILLFIDAAGFNGVGYNAFSAMMQMVAAENFTATAAGSYITFGTTPLQTVGTVERMRIDSSGTVGIGFTAPNGKLDVAGDLYVGATQNTARFKSDGTDTFVDAIPGAGAVVIRAGGSVEKLRVTANGGISFGASGTAYGTAGQILQSNGNAAPTWISTGSLAAANATTATHLSGGVAGQIPYQTAPGVTSFLSTGTAGDVLVSNGSSAATYNNTLRLAGSTNATSTTSGALQVVGGVGVGGDLFIQGDIRTNDTLFNLINGNATTVNFAGDATTLTMGASGSGTTNVRNNLTVSGNLTVQGTTTIVDSTVTNIADPIITLGGGTGNSAPTADDNKDRGVAFKWVNNGGTTSTGFFGYDDSTGYFTYVQTATITNEVVSGTKGAMDVNLAGGTAMSVVYQSSPNNTAFLAATTSGYLLQTNGTGSPPTWVSAGGVSAGSATYADNIRTISQAASAVYYPTFVDSNNASNAYESVYTTSSFSINPATGLVTISGASGDGVPILRVTGTSAPAAGFNWAGSFMNSSLTTSKNTVILIGQAESTKNSGYIGFNYAGTAGSNSSFMTIGLYANDNILNVTGGGNVGVGTTSPAAKLHVAGSSSTDFKALTLRNGDGTVGSTVILGFEVSAGTLGDDAALAAQIKGIRAGAGTNGALAFLTTNAGVPAERMRLTTNGGISFGASGTAYGSSGQILQSNGDAAPTWVTAISGSSAQVNTVLRTTSAAHYLTFVDSNNASATAESIYTTSSFSINPQSGNVGIGTTSPGSKLEIKYGVQSALTLPLTLNPGFYQAGSATGIGFLTDGNTTYTKGALVYTSNGTGWNIGDFQFLMRNDNNTNPVTLSDAVMTIYRNGNVGIGTVAPTKNLHVYTSDASVNSSFLIEHGNTSRYALMQFKGAGAKTFEIGTGGSGTGSYNGALYFFDVTAASERLRITTNGAVAFGGSTNYGTSGQLLKSNGDAAPTWVNQSTIASGQVNTVLQTANATYYPTFVDSNNAAAAAESLYTTSSFTINPGTGLLTVTKTAQIGTTVAQGDPSATDITANATLLLSGVGGNYLSFGQKASNLCQWIQSAYLNPTTATYPIALNPLGGNVGIGTVSPAAKLQVYGGQAAQQVWINYDANKAGYLGIKSTGEFQLYAYDTASAGYKNILLGVDGSTTTAGNVGIGTTSPGSKLTVSVDAATAYSAANTLTSGQWARISNPNTTAGVATTLLFEATGSGGGNGLGTISGVHTGNGSLALTFGTRNASSNVTERMRLTSDGNFVIGTTSTTNKFEVAGTAGQLFSVSDSFTGTIFSVNDVSGIPSIEVLDTGLVKMAQYNGAVAIGTGTITSSTAKLSVYGMLYTLGSQGEIRASSEITAYFSSDQRLKENIKLIENPITIIDQIRGVTFDWTDEHMARRGGEDGYFVRKHDIGVIAQEVQAVLPELVGTREDGYLAVKYEKMVPLLIEAIKAQQKTIDSLVKDLDNVKEFINDLKNKNGI